MSLLMIKKIELETETGTIINPQKAMEMLNFCSTEIIDE
jgi:hypothetical protein